MSSASNANPTFVSFASTRERVLSRSGERRPRKSEPRHPIAVSRGRGSVRATDAAAPADLHFVSDSPPMQMLLRRVQRVTEVDATLLITGASGTGKTTIAQKIHLGGRRADGPFVAVNCSSLPRELVESELFGHTVGAFTGAITERPGRVEMAHGGTLFLDEIGDLPLELQPKLLSFLQDHTFQRIGSNKVQRADVRIIAATHQDLLSMCAQKRFREDLFYRLKVLSLQVPALAEHREDIPRLAVDILARIAMRRGTSLMRLTPEAMLQLQARRWPGNIRELENVLEQATAFCETEVIFPADVAELEASAEETVAQRGGQPKAADVPECGTLSEIERAAIVRALAASQGNKAKAARCLGVSEKTVYNMLRRHGLSCPSTNGKQPCRSGRLG